MKNFFTMIQPTKAALAAATALLLTAGVQAQNGRAMESAEESARFTNPISVMPPAPGPCGRVNMLNALRITDTEATLSWNTASTADSFRVVCTQISNGLAATRTVSGINHFATFTGLLPTEQYKWYVISFCQGTQISSGTLKFTTLSTARLQNGPSRNPSLTPVCPGLGNILIPDVSYDKAIIDWSSNATYDSIHVRFNASGSLITKTISIIGTPSNSRYVLSGLTDYTMYDVTLSTFCSNGTQSAWSTTLNFTTLRAPAPRIQKNTGFTSSIVPNPATTTAKIVIESAGENFFQINIYDITGKERYNRQVEVNEAVSTVDLDLTSLPKGVYLVKVVNGSKSNVQRLIIN